MRIYAEQLADHLKAGLKPCYLVFGDEPLQKQESLDAIRRIAAANGFSERHVFALEDNPEWQEVESCCHALSLFASRQILEIELGEKLRDRVVIKNGLQAGERVVTAGTYALKARLLKSQIGDSH